MTGYLTPVAKKIVLDQLTDGQGGSYFGLATAIPLGAVPTLANITEVSTPGYARVSIAWDPATSVEPVRKVNSADVQMGPVTADMPPASYGFLTTTATGKTLAAPVLDAPTSGATSTLLAGTYYYKITAVNARGETTASNEQNQVIVAGRRILLSWSAVPGATSYRVYRSTSANTETLLTTVTTTTFTDTGAIAPGTATVPTVNTASVANLLYVWELSEPVRALAQKPIYIPKSALIIE